MHSRRAAAAGLTAHASVLHNLSGFFFSKNSLLSCSAAEPMKQELRRCLQVLGCFGFPEQQATRERSFNQEGGQKCSSAKKQRKSPCSKSIITEYSEDNLNSGQQMSLLHLWEQQQKVQINKEGKLFIWLLD